MKRKADYQKQNTPKKRKVTGEFKKPVKSSMLFAAKTKQGPEKKNVDETFNITPGAGSSNFPAVVNELNVVAQGATAETRIGRKLVMTSFELRWQWTLATTSLGGSPCRILVVYDKQANAAAPAVTDILAANAFNSPMNLANSERFVIIASKITEPISVGNNFSVNGHIYKELRLETVYNDTNAGTIADIQTGSILILVSQNGQVTTASPVFTATSRIRFEDA